jgi:hypothetical protein
MSKPLNIVHWIPKEGDKYVADQMIRLSSGNPEFGSIMLLQVVPVIRNGFLNMRNRIGFITGDVKELTKFLAENNLKYGDNFNSVVEVPHKIISIEKLESEVGEKDGYRNKINPSTKEELTFEGEQIVWRTKVVPDRPENMDIHLNHDQTTMSAPYDSAGETDIVSVTEAPVKE